MRTIFISLVLTMAFAASAQAPAPVPTPIPAPTPVVAPVVPATVEAPVAAPPETVVSTPVVAATEVAPAPDQLVASVVKVAADWKAGGALAAVAALLGLLLQVSKIDALRRLLDDKGREWVRPAALTALAAAGGIVTALQAGAPLGAAALAGAMAGLSGVGMRELFKHVSSDERSRVRVDIDAVTQATNLIQKQLEALASVQGEVAVAALAKKVATMKDMPIRSKIEALSALAVPPKAA